MEFSLGRTGGLGVSPKSFYLPQVWGTIRGLDTLLVDSQKCRIPPAGGLGVSPKSFLPPPRMGDIGG